MGQSASKNVISKDILFYLPAKVIEGVIGIITLSVYTGLFSTKVYGEYGIINPTVNMLFLVCLGWLMHASYRYVNTFKQDENLQELYSTSFFAWLIEIVVISIIIIGTSIFNNNQYFDNSLFYIACFMFISYGLSQILLNLLVAIKRVKLNLVLSVCAALCKLIFTVILTKLYSNTVVTILISHATVDLMMGIIVIIRLQMYKAINIKQFSKETLLIMLNYGYPLIGMSLTMFVLNISDRYVITYFYKEDYVGIYTANYSLASAVFTMLMMGIMRAVYPNLLLAHNTGDKDKTEELLSQGVRYYLMIALPSAVGLFLLSKPITQLLLAKSYQVGYSVIGWVAFGMMFLGLTEYCNKAWELTSNTKTILVNSLISGIVNLILNIIMIPRFGYEFAAITTCLSFVIYFVLSFFRGRSILRWKLNVATLVKLVVSVIGISMFILGIQQYLEYTMLKLLIVIFVCIVIYIALLFITGELKEEKQMILKIFNK